MKKILAVLAVGLFALMAAACTPSNFDTEKAAVARASGKTVNSCTEANHYQVAVGEPWEDLAPEEHYTGYCSAGSPEVAWAYHTVYFGGIRKQNDYAGYIDVYKQGTVNIGHLWCAISQPGATPLLRQCYTESPSNP